MVWEKHVVLVHGKKQSGKDTFARVLKELLPDHVNTLHFAGGLKEDLYRRFPVEQRHLWGTNEDKEEIIPQLNITGRKLMQWYGATMNGVWDKVWATDTFRDVERLSNAYGLERDWIAVIPDTRHRAELEIFLPYGATELKIIRPGHEDNDQHISETALDDYDFKHVIINDGTLGYFELKCEEWVRKWQADLFALENKTE